MIRLISLVKLAMPRGCSKTMMFYGQMFRLGFLRGIYLGEVIDGLRELERPPKIPRVPLYRHPVEMMTTPDHWLDEDYIYDLKCEVDDNDV